MLTKHAYKAARPRRLALLMVGLLALLCLGGGSGSVLSLSASGGGNYNDTITISVSVRADDKVNNSNFYFEIRAQDGTVVATNSFGEVPSMEGGDTYSYSWSSNNGSYPITGDYTVSFCWSTGGSHNCNVAEASTGFYSVPTLGWLLAGLGLVLLGLWGWSVRHTLFARRSAEV